MTAVEQHDGGYVARPEMIVEEPPQDALGIHPVLGADHVEHDEVDAAVALVGDDVGVGEVW